MSISPKTIDQLVEVLDSAPLEQCVVRQEFLEELNLNAENVAEASQRSVHRTHEIRNLPERKMALRDAVFVFGPKKEA